MGSLAKVGDKVQAYGNIKGVRKWRNAKVVSVLNEVYTVFFIGKGKTQHQIGKAHIRPFAKKEVVVLDVVDLTKEGDVKAHVQPSGNVINIDIDVSRPSFGAAALGDDGDELINNNDDPYYEDRNGAPYGGMNIPGDPYANDPSTPEAGNYFGSWKDSRTGRGRTYPWNDSTSDLNFQKVPDVVKEPEPDPKVLTLEEQLAFQKRLEEKMNDRHPVGFAEAQEKMALEAQRLREVRARRIERKKQFRQKIQMSVPDNGKRRWKQIKEKQEKERQLAMAKRKAAAELRRSRRKPNQPKRPAPIETESEDDDDVYDSSSEEEEITVQRPSRKRVSSTQDPAPARKEGRNGLRAAHVRRYTPSPDSVTGLDMDMILPVDGPMQKARAAREEAVREIEIIEIADDEPPSRGVYWIAAPPRRPLATGPAKFYVPSCGLSLQQKQEQFAEQVRKSLEALKLTKPPAAAADVEVVEIAQDDNEEATTTGEDNLPIAKRKPKRGHRYELRDRNAVKRSFVSPNLSKKQMEYEQEREEEEILRKCQGIDYWKIHNRVWLAQIRAVHGEPREQSQEKRDEKASVSSSSSRRKKGKPTRKRLGNSAVRTLNRVDAQTQHKVEEYERDIAAHIKDSVTTVAVTPQSCTCSKNGNGCTLGEKVFSVKAPWSTYKCSNCVGGIHVWCAGVRIAPLTAHVLCMSCAERGKAKFGIGKVKIPSLLCPLVEWACRTLPKNYEKEHRKSVQRITHHNDISAETMSVMESNINSLRCGIINPKPAIVDITQQIFEKTDGIHGR